MNIQLGTLTIIPADSARHLCAPVVAAAVSCNTSHEEIGVCEIDPEFSDTAQFCEAYGVLPQQAANCIVLEAKRGDRQWYAACIVSGASRADINGVIRKTLDARKVSFAPMDAAVAATQMEYGAITPVGLPDSWVILVDKAVAEMPYVIVGSGARSSKLAVPGYVFADLPNAQVVDRMTL